MGLPTEKVFELLLPPLRCYQIMRNHYLEFINQWNDESWVEIGSKEDYLSSHNGITEQEILNSFDYILNLPEEPSNDDILALAMNVKSGCLAYSYGDDDFFGGFSLGRYADFIVRKLGQ